MVKKWGAFGNGWEVGEVLGWVEGGSFWYGGAFVNCEVREILRVVWRWECFGSSWKVGVLGT